MRTTRTTRTGTRTRKKATTIDCAPPGRARGEFAGRGGEFAGRGGEFAGRGGEFAGRGGAPGASVSYGRATG